MGRGILMILVVAGIVSILTGVILTYVPQDMTVADIKGLNIINTTNDERASRSNPIAQHTSSPRVSEENENIGRISSLPNKCLGSALCPD
jgi:hypothetical protein